MTQKQIDEAIKETHNKMLALESEYELRKQVLYNVLAAWLKTKPNGLS